jgi:hypothetical protein
MDKNIASFLIKEYELDAKLAGLGNTETNKIVRHNTKELHQCVEEQRQYFSVEDNHTYYSYFAENSIYLRPVISHEEEYTADKLSMRISADNIKICSFTNGEMSFEMYDFRNKKYVLNYYDAQIVEDKFKGSALSNDVDCMEYALSSHVIAPVRTITAIYNKNCIIIQEMNNDNGVKEVNLIRNKMLLD